MLLQEALFDAFSHADTVGIDDRKMLLEEILALMARLPRDSWLGKQLENNIVTLCMSTASSTACFSCL